MSNNFQVVFALALCLFLSACKVSRNTSSSSIKDDIALNDTTITPPDTLLPPTPIDPIDSVDIKVYRLLKDTLTVVGVGDIMMGTNFPNTSYLPPNGGANLFSEVDTVLKNADVTFGNLEGVLLDEGGKQKYCKNPKICYLFRTPDNYVKHLVSSGFDVMSTANNHAGDFGNEGRSNTMRVLDSVGIHHAGLLSNPYCTFKVDGMKYGFAAFSPNTGTQSINDLKAAQGIVMHLDSLVDVVIVSFHGGAEGKKHERVPRKNEYFYGENRGNVHKFSHTLIDAGADIVFGHGPHITRGVEVYRKRFIAYSLGNFCTYARFSLSGISGIAPIIKVFTNAQGEFIKGEITPIYQKKPGGPKIDYNKRAIKKIQSLSELDFPESEAKIEDTGIITYID